MTVPGRGRAARMISATDTATTMEMKPDRPLEEDRAHRRKEERREEVRHEEGEGVEPRQNLQAIGRAIEQVRWQTRGRAVDDGSSSRLGDEQGLLVTRRVHGTCRTRVSKINRPDHLTRPNVRTSVIACAERAPAGSREGLSPPS